MARTFDNPDRTTIEVRSNQACCWRPDSCQCMLVFEQNTLVWDYAVEVCNIHNGLTEQALLDAVLAHEQSFNVPTGDLTERQMADQATARSNEAKRILALGAPTVRADANTKDSIETSLRARGR